MDKPFSIWQWRYQPTQSHLRACFLSPAQAFSFSICVGDSASAGDRQRVMPRLLFFILFLPLHREYYIYLFIYLSIFSLMLTITEQILSTIKK